MAVHGIPARRPRPDSLKSAANDDPGLFGRMFDLPAFDAGDDALFELAKAMKDAAQGTSAIPAGITYLGQFIDHDITFDLTSLGEMVADPDAKENFRTPSLDLDAVYGLGPSGSPHLYERDPKTFATGPRLLIGTAAESAKLVGDGNIPAQPNHDLPRNPRTGIATIVDPRNDENLLVAQIHVAMMNFHNKMVDKLAKGATPHNELFWRARQQVLWHYQWIVLQEFLETITGEKGIADRIMKAGRRFYRFKKFPFMPVEFAVAAYRFGHTMIRQEYSHNFVFRPGGAVPASLDLLFKFTAKSGDIVGELPKDGGIPVLPSNWVIDWRRFFDFKTAAGTPNFEMNFAHPIDPFVVEALHRLPGEDPKRKDAVLPFRNLKRGVMMKLPSGQAVATKMGITPMKPTQIASGPDGAKAKEQGFDRETPLWYYILKEAEQVGKKKHLGPVGATIVAEVFVGLVQGDVSSYLSASPAFSPEIGAKKGEFTMVDLLNFAGVVNPLGNG